MANGDAILILVLLGRIVEVSEASEQTAGVFGDMVARVSENLLDPATKAAALLAVRGLLRKQTA